MKVYTYQPLVAIGMLSLVGPASAAAFCGGGGGRFAWSKSIGIKNFVHSLLLGAVSSSIASAAFGKTDASIEPCFDMTTGGNNFIYSSSPTIHQKIDKKSENKNKKNLHTTRHNNINQKHKRSNSIPPPFIAYPTETYSISLADIDFDIDIDTGGVYDERGGGKARDRILPLFKAFRAEFLDGRNDIVSGTRARNDFDALTKFHAAHDFPALSACVDIKERIGRIKADFDGLVMKENISALLAAACGYDHDVAVRIDVKSDVVDFTNSRGRHRAAPLNVRRTTDLPYDQYDQISHIHHSDFTKKDVESSHDSAAIVYTSNLNINCIPCNENDHRRRLSLIDATVIGQVKMFFAKTGVVALTLLLFFIGAIVVITARTKSKPSLSNSHTSMRTAKQGFAKTISQKKIIRSFILLLATVAVVASSCSDLRETSGIEIAGPEQIGAHGEEFESGLYMESATNILDKDNVNDVLLYTRDRSNGAEVITSESTSHEEAPAFGEKAASARRLRDSSRKESADSLVRSNNSEEIFDRSLIDDDAGEKLVSSL